MDALEDIQMLTNENAQYSNILFECRSLLIELQAAQPTHIYKEQNEIADALARDGINAIVFDFPCILSSPPMVLFM